MTRIPTVIFALLCGSACITEVELASDDRTLGDDARAEQVDMVSMPDEPGICELLPECGPCADACDPDALEQHLPPGTCAAFICELTDGRTLTVHACHHE
jgi:hypothetical protein